MYIIVHLLFKQKWTSIMDSKQKSQTKFTYYKTNNLFLSFLWFRYEYIDFI